MKINIGGATIFFPEEIGFTKHMIAFALVDASLNGNRVDEDYHEHLVACVETALTDEQAEEFVNKHYIWLKDGGYDKEEIEDFIINRMLPLLIEVNNIINDNDNQRA